jgi:uncharacterized membrane protein YqgA involved in biofilm formation
MHIWGYLVNTVTVLIGSGMGLLIGRRLSQPIKRIILAGIGLSSLVIGMQMALETRKLILMVGSLVVGGILGQMIGIEEWLEKLGERIKKRVGSESSTFVLGFVTASLLFCTGPMTVVGSLEDGFSGKGDLIYIKSIMDGVSSTALTATLGIGVIFSALTVVVIQGSLTYLGMAMGDSFNVIVLNEISAVGGVLILGIGINLLEIGRIRIGNFLPALVVAGFASWWFL